MPTPRRAAEPAPEGDAGSPVRILKKYPNRRLYDTRSSSYITLADVRRMVLDAEDFQVRDAKTGEDLTRSILLQIILEEESGGVPMFSTQTLTQIIRFYGHAMQGVMGSLLEKNMAVFTDLQAQWLSQSKGIYDPRHLNPESWAQFLSGQAPLMHNLMGTYAEQTRSLLEQMQKASPLFPGVPGFTPPKPPGQK